MKISINELRSLVRRAVATQIMESASKKKPVNKTSMAESKKISVNELRSMIKEAIMNEIEVSPETSERIEKTKQEAAQKLVDSLGSRWKRAAELLKIEGDSDQEIKDSLADRFLYHLKNPNDRIDGRTPKEFVSFINTEKGLRAGIERMVVDKPVTDMPERVYQTGEEKLKAIAQEEDVSKEMARKIIDNAMRKLAQIIALTAGDKFKGKSSEDISNILKTVRKGDYVLQLKKSFQDAISQTYELLEGLVLDAAEEFIDEIDSKIDFPYENYDNLNDEEREEVDQKVFAFLDSIRVTDASDEEFSLIIDLLDYEHVEDNKKLLANLFFQSGETNVPFRRIAKAFAEKIQPQIEKQFNPETRGRGKPDENVVRAIADILSGQSEEV